MRVIMNKYREFVRMKFFLAMALVYSVQYAPITAAPINAAATTTISMKPLATEAECVNPILPTCCDGECKPNGTCTIYNGESWAYCEPVEGQTTTAPTTAAPITTDSMTSAPANCVTRKDCPLKLSDYDPGAIMYLEKLIIDDVVQEYNGRNIWESTLLLSKRENVKYDWKSFGWIPINLLWEDNQWYLKKLHYGEEWRTIGRILPHDSDCDCPCGSLIVAVEMLDNKTQTLVKKKATMRRYDGEMIAGTRD